MQRSRYGRSLCAALAPIVLALTFAGSGALAQDLQRTLFLVAKPGMNDPNFRESVVLVTPDDAGGAIGIIINRPTDRSLASILPEERFRRFTDPVFFGGPVAPNGIFALFRADQSPDDAIRMFPDLFLALTPATIDELLSRPPSAMRLYSGFSGWAPGQVQNEMLLGGWYALDADSQTVFRKDVQNIWQDLVQRARSVHAGGRAPAAEPAAFGPLTTRKSSLRRMLGKPSGQAQAFGPSGVNAARCAGRRRDQGDSQPQTRPVRAAACACNRRD